MAAQEQQEREAAAPLLCGMVRRIEWQNDCIASLERDDDCTKHTVAQRCRSTSWLRSFKSPLCGLLGFARASRTSRTSVRTRTEDERLARVAALALHPEQGGRVNPANGLLCVVVGCGAHGRNIAGELLRRGCTVRLHDALLYLVQYALDSIRETLEELVHAHLLLPCDVETLLARCTAAPSLEAAMERDPTQTGPLLVIEAVPDFVDVKWLVFDEVVGACVRCGVRPHEVLLCTNTLSCALAPIAESMPTAYAARLIGMRFLHPCWFVDMVQLYLIRVDHSTDSVRTDAHMEAAKAAIRVVQVLGLKTAGKDRMLSPEEATLCAVRQLMRVEEHGAAACVAPMQ